ncbi:MAG: zf-HC2 domain-containing protein [Gemmatimonadaceae bacterium]|nr:zf-HC2 domain-containing protein [Gemmatimonadaceae bacterium]
MSDLHLNFSALPHERPGDDDAREARHQVLATLLGAYADGELPPETVSQIDAHLLGCARCRREVELHSVMHTRLAREPGVSAPPALRERILQQVATSAALPVPVIAPVQPWWQSTAVRGGTVAIVVLAVLAVAISRRTPVAGSLATPVAASVVDAGAVPLLTHVLADYRRVTAGDLPGRARDLDAVRAAVPFPVQPLRTPAVRLLAAWSTDLQGEPAAVLAYRWQDRLVLQYLVAEPVFFRSPLIRGPVAAGSAVTAASGAQTMLAWAAEESGAILIGDAPAGALTALRVGDTGR